MDIHRLINEVQRRPALWDTSHPDHSNRVETKRLWESVAFVLGLRIDVCRSKWKNLRCSYRRLQKQQQSPATASPAPQWPYMKAMSFLESNHDDSIVTPKAEPTDAEMELEADNDLLMQEFQSMATPQAMRRLSHNISLASAAAEEQATGAGGGGAGATTGMQQRTPPTPQQGGISALAAAAASSCQCAKRVDEQVNFLQSLEREEQQLMQSTSQDLARCKNVLHVGDSDYNFLISFLPLMKQMSPLQNVSFRAKMGELLLQTMQQPLQLQAQHHLHPHPHPQPPPPSMPQSMPQPMMQQQQQQQQAQPADQQQQQQQKMQPKQEPQASQMLLNQQQMALDQAQQVSTSSTSWN